MSTKKKRSYKRSKPVRNKGRTYKTSPSKGKYRTYKTKSNQTPFWKKALSGLIGLGLIIGAILYFVYYG